jgi:hypothetical protein
MNMFQPEEIASADFRDACINMDSDTSGKVETTSIVR